VVNPLTVNTGLIVPLTGADVDLWGEDDLNPNFVAIDGLFCGVQTVSVSNVPVTLTSAAGLSPTPSAGPTQAQNRVLKFTGTLTADVTVTLPTPGMWVIDNQTVAGAFVLKFQGVTPTQVVAVPPGEVCEIYNDGANVRFVGLGRVGSLEFWGGITALPRWVTECTVKPFLLCDSTATYNFSDYPALSAIYLGKFGGNGITTFGVQDLRGRMPLAYDGTGTRITAALCGVNGQTMGASGGIAGTTMVRSDLPNQVVAISISDPGHAHGYTQNSPFGASGSGAGINGASAPGTTSTATTGITANFNLNGGVTQTVQNNLPPAQVAGIWVVKT